MFLFINFRNIHLIKIDNFEKKMFNLTNYSDDYKSVNTAFKFMQAPFGLIGIISNILAILVFQRKQLKKYSYSFYWKCLAIFENLLLLHTFRHWFRHFLNFDIDLISPFFCRFNEYQPFVAGTAAICVESLITLDRFFTIIHGKRFKIVKQRSFRFISISVIIIYSLLLNIGLPLNYRLDEVSGSNGTFICHVSVETFKQISTFLLINVLVFNLFINSFLDLSIIYHIITTRKNIRSINRFSFIDRQFAISAITINVTSLLIKLPFFFGNFLATYLNLTPEQIELIFTVCLTISLIDKVDIFLINMIVNSTFRQEFLSMFAFRNSHNSPMKLNSVSNQFPRRPTLSKSEIIELLQSK